MAIIMEVRGAAVHAFKLISGNIQVIYITWSVPDLYLQPLPDRNPRVTRQDLNPNYTTAIPDVNTTSGDMNFYIPHQKPHKLFQ